MKLPIKFIVSGSSALLLQKGMKEFLVGRSLEFEVMPLDFFGFVKFKSIKENKNIDELEKLKTSARDKLLDTKKLHTFLEENLFELSKHEKYLEFCLSDFIQKGGFPEGFETADMTRWYDKLVSDTLKKIVYRDVVKSYGIKTPENVERLLLFIAEHEAQTFSHLSISRNLDIDKEALSNYLTYLKNAFIVSEATIYAKSLEKQLRSNKKFYLTDPGVRNSLLLDFNVLHKPTLGLVMESIVHNHCKNISKDVHYWRSASRYEVDVVLGLENALPIEVKYKDNIREKDVVGLKRFMREFKVEQGVVVTKNKLELRENILYIPLWLFLVLLSK